MDALPLFFEALLALSAISFFVCACLAADGDCSMPHGRKQAVTSAAALKPRMLARAPLGI